MSDRYTRLEATITAITDSAVRLEVEGVQGWVPRSLIHGEDDRELDEDIVGCDMEIRIFAWKADEIGFPAARDRRQGDLGL